MSVVRRVVQGVARRAKGDSSYTIHPDIRLRSLLEIVNQRRKAALRGALGVRRKFGESKGTVFLGTGVLIRSAHLIRCGRSLTIDDYAAVDALSREGLILGDNVRIGRYATIKCTGVISNLGRGMTIGDNSNIGDYNYITGDGGITIGNYVLFGPHVKVHAENHVFDRTDIPIKEQGVRSLGIVIEDDCWIGAGSTILDGVTIGRGTIIAAGSVVTKSVPPYSIVGGIPARFIRSRIEQREPAGFQAVQIPRA